MQHRQFFATMGAVAALAALAACSGTSTGPGTNNDALTSQISTDAAANAGQAAVSDLAQTGDDAAAGSYSIAGHGVSASLIHALSSNGCAQSGGDGDLRWYCVPDTLTIANGIMTDTLIRTRNYEFFVHGAPRSTFSDTTDSINWGGANGILVYVAVHRPRWTGASQRTGNHSVTDKTPSFADDSIRTWNGNTLVNDTAAFTGTLWSVNYTGMAYDTSANVVFIHPRVTHPFPISGQFHRWATWNYSATGPATKAGSVSRHIVVTFNGTQTAMLQVIGTTTLTCNLDLITGDVSDCH